MKSRARVIVAAVAHEVDEVVCIVPDHATVTPNHFLGEERRDRRQQGMAGSLGGDRPHGGRRGTAGRIAGASRVVALGADRDSVPKRRRTLSSLCVTGRGGIGIFSVGWGHAPGIGTRVGVTVACRRSLAAEQLGHPSRVTVHRCTPGGRRASCVVRSRLLWAKVRGVLLKCGVP